MHTLSRRIASKRAPWLIGAFAPLVFVLQAIAFAGMAATVSELFDPAPWFALLAALSILRWDGVARRWVAVVAALAGLMTLEWVAWYVRLSLAPGSTTAYGFQQQTYALLDMLLPAYLIQGLALFALCVTASVMSIIGIKRAEQTRLLSSAG